MAAVERKFNFSAGPAVLPESVLKVCQDEMFSWQGCGIGVMEMSHRSPEFSTIINTAVADLTELLQVPENYQVLFMQGGATTQFSCVPLNLSGLSGDPPDYIVTGGWSKKSYQEACKLLGDENVNLVCDNTATLSMDVSPVEEWNLNPNASYTHYCVNETVFGLKMADIPSVNNILVADFSSCFMSEPIDVSRFGVIYAGAQKNIGPAGVTVVIIRKDLLGVALPQCPILLNYDTHAKKNSMYNTPPCWPIYVCGLVFQWMKEQDGLVHIQEHNNTKANRIYDIITNSTLFRCPVAEKYRSNMNIRIEIWKENVRESELEQLFLTESSSRNLCNLKGHRSLGGIRASLYNAQTTEAVDALATFMTEFDQTHG